MDDKEITLGVLSAVESDSTITQRAVASELDIALGLANAYLKRCVKKGLIKVKAVPARRYRYYLTPKGFSEKTRLTAEYLSQSFQFFRVARDQCIEIFAQCDANGWRRVALCGVSDLAEIATLCVRDCQVELMGIVGPSNPEDQFAGLALYENLAQVGDVDAVVLTDLVSAYETYRKLADQMPEERILTPPLLNITRNAGQEMEEAS